MLRPKTKKRLMVLLVGGIAGAGIATAAVIIQLHRYENHLLAFRKQGLSDYHHGNYRSAAKNLASYLGNDRMDVEAIFAYAVTRSRLPRPDMGNLLDAQRLFNRYLELSPGDIDAEHQLLDIYQKLHYFTEAMSTATDLLSKNPDDVPALSAKLQQLIRTRKYSDALPVSMRLNQLTPCDFRTQETTFDLMARTGKSPAQIIDRGDQLLKTHLDDTRFQLVRALAAYFAGNVEEAKKWLRAAAANPSSDAEFTLLLAGSFDNLEMRDDSRTLLQRAATQPLASPSIKAKFVQQLWEFGEFDAALAVLNGLNPADPAADSQLLGLDALVQYSLVQNSQAQNSHQSATNQSVLDALNRRADDPTATAWALLLATVLNPSQADPVWSVHQCQAAEKLDPDNPDVRFYLAGDYQRMGESELALQCLGQTAKMQPEWAQPQVDIALLLVDRGQFADAIAPAQTACGLDPRSQTAKITLGIAEYRRLTATAYTTQISLALDYIQQVRRTAPADPKLLAANVDLLVRTNRKTEAITLATASLADSPALLRELAAADKSDQLGITKAITDRAMRCQPPTPAQALDQASAFAIADDMSDAEKCVTAMQSRQTVDWKLAALQAREVMHDAAVGSAWEQLADSEPRNLEVQLAAMRSSAVNANRALMDRTINRRKLLTSEDAIEWKLARAVWQLGATKNARHSANAAVVEMAEVARQVPGYARPQVIWADALLKLGDISGAVAHLHAAAQIDPENEEVKMKLAKLLTEQGHADNTASIVVGAQLN